MLDHKEDADNLYINSLNYRRRLYERGFCIQCRQQKEPGRENKLLCTGCAAKNYVNYKKRKKRLMEQGLCVVCGKRPAKAGIQTCLQCAVKRADNNRKGREKEKERVMENAE